VIAYESPHRILETLDLMARALPDREIVVARELTKAHEEFLRGRPAEILAALVARGEVRGECVLVIAGAPETDEPADPARLEAVLAVARAEGLTARGLTNLLVAALGMPRNRAYAIAHGREAATPPDR
jgi:16S rRNA (cytidine1402-2'-O)-methyltransferase